MPALASGLTVLGASIALFGWLYDVEHLYAPLAGAVSMQPNTAIGFVLAGVAIFAAAVRWHYRLRPIRWGLELALLALASVTLFEYVVDVDLGIDTFVMSLSEAADPLAPARRMALSTALGFLLLGSALVANHWLTVKGRFWSRFLAVLALLVALVSLLGYAYDIPALYEGAAGSTAMALSTAMLLFLCSTAVIWLQPKYGFPVLLMSNTMVGAHLRALLPMITVAPLLVGGLVSIGYGHLYSGLLAVALTSVGSVVAAAVVAALSLVVLQRFEGALLVRDRALGHTSNGVMITDHRIAGEPVVYINDAFTQITGYREEDCVGRNPRFLNRDVRSEQLPALAEIRDAVKNNESCSVELRNRRADGSIFWNRVHVAPVFDYRGDATHFIGILDDITETKAQQARLEEALKSAEQANAMRDAFVRLITHELRTPLNSALTWLRLMEVDDRPETVEKGIGVVTKSVESQSRLIEDLVDVTSFSVSGVSLEPERTDIGELVAAVVREQQPAIEAAGLGLQLQVAKGDFTITGDPVRLQQIVRNLLNNASKYTPSGGRIMVTVSATDAEVKLSVADTGKGLDDEQMTQVFEPFWRASSSQPGLGVGLAIVASLVEAHGGEIQVVSGGPNTGATFTVSLPKDHEVEERAALADRIAR